MKKILKLLVIVLLLCCVISCDSNENDIENEEKEDTISPIINFYGEKSITIEIGTEVDLMDLVNGIDNIDLNITDEIIINDNGFDCNKEGTYKITYNLKDSSGNEAQTVEREIIVIDSKSVRLIAHRGGKGFGLENTYQAFEKAVENGYYGLECDIQLTKDEVMVVYHDLNIKNLSGIDINIKDITWNTLKDIVLTKNETDGKTYTGNVLLFKDYLNLVKNSDCKAFIELKETSTLKTIEIMMKEIEEAGLPLNQYVIIANSASIDLLVELRSRYPEMKLQFVARTEYQKYMTKCLANKIDLDVSYTVFDENFEEAINYVNMFHQMGLEVNIWVINNQKDIEKYLELGIDYFTTDSILPVIDTK